MNKHIRKILAAGMTTSVIMMSTGLVLADETEVAVPEETTVESEAVTEETSDSSSQTVEEVEESQVADEATDRAAIPGGGVEVNEVNFPDSALRDCVHAVIDTNRDWYLSPEEIESTVSINFSQADITDPTGLEIFSNAEFICLDFTKIKELDVSGFDKLKTLSVIQTGLRDLKINSGLTTLKCYQNCLSELDLSVAPNLSYVRCQWNDIAEIDISNNPLLANVYLNGVKEVKDAFHFNSHVLGESEFSYEMSTNIICNYQPEETVKPDEVKPDEVKPDESKPNEVKPVEEKPETVATIDMYRLYNPNSGEHFFTSSAGERDLLVSAGWTNEGIGWKAPVTSNTPVYRLYNPNGGEHHYTTSVAEKNNLVAMGWNDEGIGWYSDDNHGVAVYRQYNPNSFSNNHNYSTSASEDAWLVSLGWESEGVAWYGVA